MTDHWLDWFSLLGRWAHILTGIAWIGSSFFFMWLDANLRPAEPPEHGVEGELYMVHSGGYYKVHKKLFAYGNLPNILHWFKWEAAFTWITGIFLLGLIYYSGGSMMMVDEEIRVISAQAAISLGVGTLIVSWFLYDGIWRVLGKFGPLPVFATAGLILGASYLLLHYLSGRAAYMHVGAMLGTWMVANVWVHIIPNQKRMLAEAESGKTPDYLLGAQAKYRSIHNNYFTLPVITIMISNHHPVTFGHKYAWMVLALIFLGGAFVRHVFNLRNKGKSFYWPMVPAALCFLAAIMTTAPSFSPVSSQTEPLDTPAAAAPGNNANAHPESNIAAPEVAATAGVTALSSSEAPSTAEQLPIRGFIKGRIRYNGTLPSQEVLKVPAGCLKESTAVYKDDILAGAQQTLQNVIVYVGKGRPAFQGSADSTEVIVDQHSCTYHPKVVAAMVGQPVVFVNSDSIFHNVKGNTKQNTPFNVSMPKKGQRLVRTFDKAEFVVHAKCSVHPWMSSFIGVFDHPWFSVTRDKGEYLIQGLPSGEYEIIAWHATLGTQSKTVTLKDGEDLNADFTFNLPTK